MLFKCYSHFAKVFRQIKFRKRNKFKLYPPSDSLHIKLNEDIDLLFISLRHPNSQ